MAPDSGKIRVVVTGLGAVTPLGNSRPGVLARHLRGPVGHRADHPVRRQAPRRRLAGEVKGFDPPKVIEKKELKKLDRFIQFALAAASGGRRGRQGRLLPDGPDARRRSRRLRDRRHPVRPRVAPGASSRRGPSRISPFFVPSLIVNMASGQLSIRYELKGPNSSRGDRLRDGQRTRSARRSGSSSAATPTSWSPAARRRPSTTLRIGGFAQMQALSTRNDEPARASRPFDADRDGFVLGEGAGIVVLEELEHARRRGARIYAEIVGYGTTADAYHMTAPDPDGDGAQSAHDGRAAGRRPPARGRRLRQRPRHLDRRQRQDRDAGDQARCSATTPRGSPCRRPSR